MANLHEDLTGVKKTNQSLRRMVHQLAQLVEISVTLNSTLDIKELLNFIIHTAVNLLDCSAASIMLYNEQRGELRFAAATGSEPEKLAQIPVPLDGSIAGTIFQENRSMVINDVSKDSRHYTGVGDRVKFQTTSMVGVPLRIQEKVIGVLEALNKKNGQFDQDDIHVLTVIASQAAVAINNARLVSALQKTYEDLSRLDTMKTNFMAIASHELRTPLGVILGYATFLKEDAQGELSEHANMVLSSAMKLRSLVEDMTNMNLLQMGSAELNLQPVPIQKVIRDASQEIEATARAKGHHLTLELSEIPIQVMVDCEKMVLAFVNVLSNAVRFTPGGGQITISAVPTSREVRIDFKDTGIGIPDNELDKIFREFYQVEHHLTRRYGGLGLGLSIAKGIVELHQGRIWAESPGIEQGSTIHIVLPKFQS